MKSSRFVLRYRGSGPKPAQDVERILNTGGLQMLDESPRMMLVELPASAEPDLESLLTELTDWIAVPERTISLPNPRPRLRK